MEEQVRELQAAVERLAQENQVLRQGQASMVALVESVGRLANNLQRGDRKLAKALVDLRSSQTKMPVSVGQVSNRSLNGL